jgi:hypothetical protein
MDRIGRAGSRLRSQTSDPGTDRCRPSGPTMSQAKASRIRRKGQPESVATHAAGCEATVGTVVYGTIPAPSHSMTRLSTQDVTDKIDEST